MELNELKARYRIPRAWCDLGLKGEPATSCCSPLRADRTPSFSVFDEGCRFHDFGTGEGGDVIDFVAKARGCDLAAAIKFIEDRLGIVRPARKPRSTQEARPKLPQLRRGTDAELRELSERRGFSIEGLRLTERRGLLFFTVLWGFSAWAVTDSRRQLVEFRRLDGAPWPAFGRLCVRKAHCSGRGKSWPVGVKESAEFRKIVLVEGGPDVLACHCLAIAEGKAESVAIIGVLGASNHKLAPEALSLLRDKQVLIVPHCDDAGRAAMRSWARQLKDAGAARVTAFDLSGLTLADGNTGKDLADVCRIGGDCFENERKFSALLP